MSERIVDQPLRIGVYAHLTEDEPSALTYRRSLELFATAEISGFDGVWVRQFHLRQDGGSRGGLPAPLIFLAAITARTSTITLGTAAITLPLEHPVRVAENAAVLDAISGGRVQLGVANGGRPPLAAQRRTRKFTRITTHDRSRRIMAKLQHFGWFFGRAFGPQGWGREDYRWNYDWRKPAIYQQSATTLEQAGIDLLIIEDHVSAGHDEVRSLRLATAIGAPKHSPLILSPYLFAATRHLGVVPTVNTGYYAPYHGARQFATLHHLSDERVGLNLVTDVGSSRHFGIPELPHDAAYDRATEWVDVVRRLWGSWRPGALVEDRETWTYADGGLVDAFAHEGEYFSVRGPLNAVPFERDEPIIVSPGGSARGIRFTASRADVHLAATTLVAEQVRAYRDRVAAAAVEAGRDPAGIKVLFVFAPEVVDSVEEAERLVAASAEPSDAELYRTVVARSSGFEVDFTRLDLDRPLPADVFGDHVSRGSIDGFLAGVGDPATTPLREYFRAAYRKRLVTEPGGAVGTAEQIADFIEALGEDAGNDGLLIAGDLHPVTVHRTLDRLVPALRRRGVLRNEFGDVGIRNNLHD